MTLAATIIAQGLATCAVAVAIWAGVLAWQQDRKRGKR